MEKRKFIEKIQSLVSQADTEKALNELVHYLDQDKRYRRLEDIALKTQALYSKTRLDEEKGILSFDKAKLNNNLVSDSILQLLSDLENDNLNPKRYQIEKDKTAKWQLWVSLATLLVIAGGVGFWIFGTGGEVEECPSFNRSSLFNIMILPFDNLDGSGDQPHIQIKKGLVQKIFDYKLDKKADVETNLNKFLKGQGITTLEAEEAGKDCDAKLVMWGSSERVGDDKEITARYKLLSNDGGLDLTKLDINDSDLSIDTVRTISSIKSGGTLTQNVEIIIKAFFGLISHELDMKEEAIQNLEAVVAEMNPQDSNHLVFSNILAADYIDTEQYDKAIKTYDRLLEAHPNYKLANQNQGILLYKNGAYAESIQKLDMAIGEEKEPTNTARLRKIRGDAYAENGQYKKAKSEYQKAEQEYQKVENADPAKATILADRIKGIDQKISSSQNNITQVTSSGNFTTVDPNKVRKQLDLAASYRNLGEYQKAAPAATKVLRYQKKNFAAYQILIEAELEKKNTKKAKALFDKAINAGVDKKALYKAFPQFRPKVNYTRSLFTPIQLPKN